MQKALAILLCLFCLNGLAQIYFTEINVETIKNSK